MSRLVLAGRVLFGAWMLLSGANHFFLDLWPAPAGHEPLAVQLMTALVNSQLFDVAMAIQLVAGALILAGILVPLALCIVMPVSTCALYWALVLERAPLGAALALVVFALNGLLMLAYLDYYRDALQRHATTLGESAGRRSIFETTYVYPRGRIARGEFIAALVTLLAVVAFYLFFVGGRTSQWCVPVLLFPAIILHARRLHDMGRSAWLLVLPGAMMIAAFAIWLRLASFGEQVDATLPTVALAVSAAFALWGCIGGSRNAARA